MKKLDIKSTIFGFFIWLILTSVIVCASLLYKADEIEYIPKDTTWNVNNVSDALSDIKDNYISKSKIKGLSWDFDYKNSAYKFNIPISGTYKIELWGAQGNYYDTGLNYNNAGKGAYTSGIIHFSKNELIYIYVGQHSHDSSNYYQNMFNGGGYAVGEYKNHYNSSGGGATDVRFFDDYTPNENDLLWDSSIGLKSRIMVAGAGGGNYYAGEVSRSVGGDAGGLAGYSGHSLYGNLYNNPDYICYGGTQTGGGERMTPSTRGNNNNSGSFGQGGNAATSGTFAVGGGGGSGYYGGGGATHNDSDGSSGGGGGSSFISGHDGCIAINEDGTHKNNSIHYSNKVFTNTVMIDGKGCVWDTDVTTKCDGMPKHDGIGTMTGNVGNGYARITLINVD